MDLLNKAKLAEPPNGRVCWLQYKPIWEALRDRGFGVKGAAVWIGNEEGLGKAKVKKLENAIHSWKRLEKEKLRKEK